MLTKLSLDVKERIYWFRFFLGVAAALVCIAFNLTDLLGMGFGLLLYLSSYLIVRYVFKIGAERVGSESKLYSIGAGIYFITWNALWIFFYTLTNVKG